MRGDDEEERLDPDDGLPPMPSRFYLQLTVGALLMVTLALIGGLPGALGLRQERTAGVGVTVQPIATAPTEIRTATPRAPRVEVAAPNAGIASPTPSPTNAVTRYAVGNTGGDGVWLRKTPSMSDRLIAWRDGTTMEVIGPDATGEGLTWKNVRDPRGNTGYIPVQYLVPASSGR